jgi:hypothetical protein
MTSLSSPCPLLTLFHRGAVRGALSPPRPAGGAWATHPERGGRLLYSRKRIPEFPGGALLERSEVADQAQARDPTLLSRAP